MASVRVGDKVTTVFDGEVVAVDDELGKVTLVGNTRGAQHIDWEMEVHWATEFYEGRPPVGHSDDLDAYLREERAKYITRIADLESLLAEAQGEIGRLRKENEDAVRHFNNAKAEVRRLLDSGTTVHLTLHGAEAEAVAKAVTEAKVRVEGSRVIER